MPQGNRPGDQRRADATAARAKGATTRAAGTTRGETTSGSRSNSRGGMSPIGSSQPPSMGLSQSAINNASFIDYRRKPGDTARETLDLGRFAGPTFHDRLTDYHRRLTEIDRRNVRDTYSAENNDIMNGHPFGKRPPVIKGTQNTTSPKSAPDIRSGRELRKLASDTRAGHRREVGKNPVLDDLNEQNVRNANNTALMHENAAKSMANAHANAYYGAQTDRMREMTGNKRQTGENLTLVDNYDGVPKGTFLTTEPPAIREDRYTGVAPSDEHRGGRPAGVHVSEAPPKSIGTQFKMTAPHLGRAAMAGLAAGAMTMAHDARKTGSEGTPSRSQEANTNRGQKASDMGPVKGRFLQKLNEYDGGQPKQSGKGHSTGTRVVGK